MENMKTLPQLYKEVIEESLGLITHIDKDGDVQFKHPNLGGLFIAMDEENDPEHMSIVFPTFFDLDHGLNRQQLLEISNQVNCVTKSTKLVMNESSGAISLVANMLVAGPDNMPTKEHLSAILPRAVQMIEYTLRLFIKAAKSEHENTQVDLVH